MANPLGFFKKIAPWLTTVAQLTPIGPAVSVAADILTKVSGEEVKPDQIGSALEKLGMSEDGRLKMAAADQEYAQVARKMGYDHSEKLLELENADRADARDLAKTWRDNTHRNLAWAAVLTLVLCIALLAFLELPQTSRDPLLVLLGAVIASYKDVYGFFFGSSAGNKAKDEIIGEIAKMP